MFSFLKLPDFFLPAQEVNSIYFIFYSVPIAWRVSFANHLLLLMTPWEHIVGGNYWRAPLFFSIADYSALYDLRGTVHQNIFGPYFTPAYAYRIVFLNDSVSKRRKMVSKESTWFLTTYHWCEYKHWKIKVIVMKRNEEILMNLV